MSGALVSALLDELGDQELRDLAMRLRPYLETVAPDASPGLLSVRGAAAHLGLHEGTVARLARTGRIPGAVKVGGLWRFDPEHLVALPAVPARHRDGSRRQARRASPGRPAGTSRVADAIRGE